MSAALQAKFEEFKNSKEFKCIESIRDVCNQLNINENRMSDLLSFKDLTEYWEPFLERLFKLGVCFKQVGKLKELRMHWIRPIFFMGTDSDKVTIDGKVYEPGSEFVNLGFTLFRSLGLFLDKLKLMDSLEPSNFKKSKKEIQDACSSFFKDLQKYLKNNGYVKLKVVINDVLKPLKELRRANFNLFCQEFKELGYEELNIFHDRKELKTFRDAVNCKFFFKV